LRVAAQAGRLRVTAQAGRLRVAAQAGRWRVAAQDCLVNSNRVTWRAPRAVE